MDSNKKSGRYDRIIRQLEKLLTEFNGPIARMATINAVLHHKMDYFFWTGFYLLREGELIVGPYQGPVACQLLAKDTGVCWAAINRGEPVIVKDVHEFPGHIACDSRSRSEITIPLRNERNEIVGVFDADSKDIGSFDETDRDNLNTIIAMVYWRQEGSR